MANKLINVEVFKAGVDAKLGAGRKFAQFVESESVEGLQAHTVNMITNDYIGDATVVAQGAKIPVSDLAQTKTPVKFEKIAKGVKITDEELNQTFGDTLANAEKQTVAAIESKMEAKVAELFQSAKFKVEAEAIDAAAVLSAITAMGEQFEEGANFLLVNPSDFANLQAVIKPSDNSELQGSVFGIGLIMSTRIDAGEAVLIQAGAIKELVQKETDVEPARVAGEKSTEIYTDKIHGVYIQDQSKLVLITAPVGV